MSVVLAFLVKVLAWGGGLLLLGLAIFVHELGHFLAARWLGFKIEAFSIGLGPALWKRRVKGVEYKIGWIPFGGYVMLPQLDPSGMEHLQGESETPAENLPDAAPWKRIIVSVAGPLGNVVLAVVLAYVIYGVAGSDTKVIDNHVGRLDESSEAWKAGLRSGDRILSVNGEKVDDWMGLITENALTGGKGSVTLAVERNGQTQEIEVPVQTNALHGFYMLDGVGPKVLCRVSQVTAGFPAAKAGVKPGDVLQTVDGQPVWGFEQFIGMVQEKGTNTLALGVLRGNVEHVLEMAPLYDKAIGRALIGVSCSSGYSKPWAQLQGDAMMVVRVLKALAMPKNVGERKEMAKGIGGPVLILDMLQQSIQRGPLDAFGFLRMICVNLAILNLLPFPVLDGGHVLFALYELITRRKPHPRVVAALVNAFAVLLIGMMVFLVGRDIVRKVNVVKIQREMERQQQDGR